MKKIGLLIAVLATLVLAAQVDTWYWDGSQWVKNILNDPYALARLFSQYPTGGACNKQTWTFTFRAKASMAQWVEWAITGAEWKWQIRKVGPNLCDTSGFYCGDCIGMYVKSNYYVDLTFSGFGNLYNGSSIDQWIEIWYAFAESNTPPSTGWMTPEELNAYTMHFDDSQNLHNGISWKWWNKIHVTNCNSYCEYEDIDGGTVTISLAPVKPYIDPATGGFLPVQ